MHMLINSHVHINTEQHLFKQVTQTYSDRYKFTYSLSQMCILLFIYMLTHSLIHLNLIRISIVTNYTYKHMYIHICILTHSHKYAHTFINLSEHVHTYTQINMFTNSLI